MSALRRTAGEQVRVSDRVRTREVLASWGFFTDLGYVDWREYERPS